MTSHNELFEKNLKKYIESMPIKPEGFEKVDPSILEFCNTEQGELSLKKIVEGKDEYYHSPAGAREEAHKIWTHETLFFYDIVICYGLGLGYLVDAADEWLREAPETRKLIIIEDDPKVFVRFFQSPRAEAILDHPQVKIVHIREVGTDDNVLLSVLHASAILPYLFRHLLFLALPYYAKTKERDFNNLKGQIYYLKEIVDRGLETSYYMCDIVYNHLKNLKFLPESYATVKEADILKGIPVIICGGGSSLEDMLPKLKELQDKAIIVGVGAGISILSQAGVRPQLCCGLDPTMKHTARLMMNSQFEVPFLYSTRIHFRAMEMMQAPFIVTLKEGGDEIQWIFNKLQLEIGRGAPGVGVANYASNYLQMMGCDPIMLIGIDLAHTKGKAYAEGFLEHPLAANLLTCQRGSSLQYTRDLSEEEKEKMSEEDEYMNLSTTAQFLLEMQSYEEFAVKYPSTTYINLSPIGTKIPHFEKLSIEEAQEKHLNRTMDLSSLLHGRIFQTKMTGIDRDKISVYYHEWIALVEEGQKNCEKILEELQGILDPAAETQVVPDSLNKMIEDLLASEAYKHLMIKYDNYYKDMEKYRLKWWPSKATEVALSLKHFEFLNYISTMALRFFHEITSEIDVNQENHWSSFPASEGIAGVKSGKGDIYKLENGKLNIVDGELKISYKESYVPVEEKIFYPGGAVEFLQHRKGDKLHGPTTYYGKNGEILASSWYVDGRKQGKACKYYPSGALYAVERYRDGKIQGKQEYFYESGLQRTVMNFDQGILHGDTTLYHPNGLKKRTIQFHDGKRSGEEKIWYPNGALRLELNYVDNEPMGMASSWFENGQPELTIFYWSPGKMEKIEEWDLAGNKIQNQIVSNDRMIHEVDEMKSKLDGLQSQLDEMTSKMPFLENFEELKQKFGANAEENLKAIAEEMKKLGSLFDDKGK